MMDFKKIDYKKLYDDIINADPKIRLITICDLNGRVMYSEHREGVTNLLTPEESKQSLELAVNSWNTQQTCTKDWKRKICFGRI
jgi:plasmid stability protein